MVADFEGEKQMYKKAHVFFSNREWLFYSCAACAACLVAMGTVRHVLIFGSLSPRLSCNISSLPPRRGSILRAELHQAVRSLLRCAAQALPLCFFSSLLCWPSASHPSTLHRASPLRATSVQTQTGL